ncbi:MAG: hypothetical protein KJZ77_14785 [Anaerolineales bacterium]|nr:hypothetical protein [Anaerolineales bacterium]
MLDMKQTLINAAIGFLAFLVSAYYLYQNYFGSRVRLTFRAGCYMWLVLITGAVMVCTGIYAVLELIWENL